MDSTFMYYAEEMHTLKSYDLKKQGMDFHNIDSKVYWNADRKLWSNERSWYSGGSEFKFSPRDRLYWLK
jgi:hypothetical protein